MSGSKGALAQPRGCGDRYGGKSGCHGSVKVSVHLGVAGFTWTTDMMRLVLGLLVLTAIAGCETVTPGTPAGLAYCASLFRVYAKLRPDAMNLDQWGKVAWDRGLKTYDKDGDGKVDGAEWSAQARARLARATTPQEVKAGQQWLRWSEKTFDKLDQGHKG